MKKITMNVHFSTKRQRSQHNDVIIYDVINVLVIFLVGRRPAVVSFPPVSTVIISSPLKLYKNIFTHKHTRVLLTKAGRTKLYISNFISTISNYEFTITKTCCLLEINEALGLRDQPSETNTLLFT